MVEMSGGRNGGARGGLGTVREEPLVMLTATESSETVETGQDMRARAKTLSWMASLSVAAGEIRAVVRHRHASVSARVAAAADGATELEFEKPVWAPAPGQAAVVYDAADERVLGGGWITGALA